MLSVCTMKLPQQEKRAIMLHHFDRHSVRTIAEMTGRSVGTVTKQLSRAYTRLRKHLLEL
ncbi:MAG: sigma-70 family RNA polymerase sigma factor [Sedimentisphaerales bacterium]|nr:sigma-70 family RNA polymerase sigma factor [Sedimentisphaerales bacterium]